MSYAPNPTPTPFPCEPGESWHIPEGGEAIVCQPATSTPPPLARTGGDATPTLEVAILAVTLIAAGAFLVTYRKLGRR